MTSVIRYCTDCGASDEGAGRQFCTTCGAPAPRAVTTPVPGAATTPVVQSPTPVGTHAPTPTVAQPAPPHQYTAAVIGTTRLLSALCMLSGIVAVARFESTTPIGRRLIVASVIIAMCGQFFTHLAGKPDPPAWTGAVLTLFWMGLVGLAILWLVSVQ